MANAADDQLTFAEHLHELRRRLLGSVLVMVAGGSVGYTFRSPIIHFLQKPLKQQLYYTSPTGSFEFVMQISLLVGLLCALPILLYNILRFIEPAFKRRFSNKLIFGLMSSSIGLAFAGLAFGYYVSLPPALHFFNQVGTSNLHPLISVNEYFSFVLNYLGAFALTFQIPLVLLFANHIRPFGPGGINKWRKYVIVAAFGIAIVLPSAPDPLSQVILAAPIIVLYEISNVLIWIVNRKRPVLVPVTDDEPAQEQSQTHAPQAEVTRPMPPSMTQVFERSRSTEPTTTPVSPISQQVAQIQKTLSPRPRRSIDGMSTHATRRPMARMVLRPMPSRTMPLTRQQPPQQSLRQSYAAQPKVIDQPQPDLLSELLNLHSEDTET
jgi:sec-independent protein translocase protein TatC